MRRMLILVSLLSLGVTILGCNQTTTTTATTDITSMTTASTSETNASTTTTSTLLDYYDNEYTNPLKGIDVGGTDNLNLTYGSSTVTLENEYIRVVFNKNNGSLREVCNKISKVYLTQNNLLSFGIKIQKASKELILFSDFSIETIADDSAMKTIRLTWEFEKDLVAIVDASLAETSKEVVFRLQLQNNLASDPVISVKYPLIENFGTLYEPERDLFASPVATGYLFENPTINFNLSNFKGITKDLGMYPSGWEYPMQMMAYYSKGIGGFSFWTRDSGTVIKSFEFTGAGTPKLKAGVYHFLDEIADGDVVFDYDIAITCLEKGVWEEAADLYRSWALNQPWASKGALRERTDIDQDLFENTGLVNFGIRGNGSVYWPDLPDIYELFHTTLDTKIFNIFLNSWQRIHISNEFNSDWDSYFPPNLNYNFIAQINDYGDSFALFEFNTLYNKNHYLVISDGWVARAIELRNGNKALFTWTSGSDLREWYFICPSFSEWSSFSLAKDQEILNYGSNGLYHDVGTAAVAPLQCFDATHSHWPKVNIIPDYIELERLSKELALENGKYSVGQELIYEQLLPYIDYYQARANAGLLSWMESDRFRVLLANGSATKIPLFDYVYHTHGALRIDGFMMPLTELGGGYYHTLAKTVLEGGLPEFNFEFMSTTLQLEEVDAEMLSFVGELAKARTTYGKSFLVYGEMVTAPQIGTGTISFDFKNSNVVSGSSILQGTVTVDKIVTSAFRHGDEVALFFCNITDSAIESAFVINAGRDYGLNEGGVYVDDTLINSFSEGKAFVNMTFEPRKVYMLKLGLGQ